MSISIWIALVLIAGAAGAGYWIRRLQAEANVSSAERRARDIVRKAEADAESKLKEAVLEAKEEVHRLRAELERETRERRADVQRTERRLQQKEETLDRKAEALERKEEALNRKEQALSAQKTRVDQLEQDRLRELERVSQLTTEEARNILMQQVEQEARQDAARLIRQIEAEAREEVEQRAKMVLATAIQRTAADHTAETTVSVVQLPNDEMKGRIIGREGRNIRTLEMLTGIDVIIDDTPEAVILSGFDPVRREIARIALTKLIADGRIHPARIEEMVEKAQREVDLAVREAGEQAALEAGVPGLHPELIKLLGRLKYRTSYGQNVLKHVVEVSLLSGLMAAELGVDVEVAKRAGLLHDIGKALTHEVEGPHVEVGRDVLRKYRESEAVIHAMETHHGDVEPRSVEAVLVTAADAVSASRPGARAESLEHYIKRLRKLESIASDYPGVEKTYAIQAGREIRVIVKPDKLDDYGIIKAAKDLARKIREELDYPGQIKIVVIRETRAVEYAK